MAETGDQLVSLQTLLDPTELEYIGSNPMEIGTASHQTLVELAEGWRADLQRVVREQEQRLSGTVWNADDYVGAMSTRTLLDRALRSLPRPIGAVVVKWLATTDGVLFRFTEHDHTGLLARVAAEDLSQYGWWWHRIPIRGPVRQDLDRYA